MKLTKDTFQKNRLLSIRVFLLLAFVSLWSVGRGQMKVSGSASQISETCYELTPDAKNQEGNIFSRQKIDLKQDFTIAVTMNFGRQNATTSGADGIAFILATDTTIAVSGLGGGLGYVGVSPSLVVEFDTYQNDPFGDPAEDHVALIRNGSPDHNTNTISGPFPLGSNIEDSRDHDVVISWKADIQEFTVYFDCIKVLGYVGPITGPFLGGSSTAFWGFTASTGSAYNRQTVCFKTASQVDVLKDLTYCDSATVKLDGGPGGLSYTWSPAAVFNDPQSPKPTIHIDKTTTIFLEKTSTCGSITEDSFNIYIVPNTINLDLGPDQSICEGSSIPLTVGQSGAQYTWSTGDTTQSITVGEAGVYSVEVNDGHCIKQDQIAISVNPLPLILAPADTTVCQDSPAILSAYSNDGELEWENGTKGNKLTINEEGIYTVTATNSCGQVAQDILVHLKNCGNYFIPNVFSPNYDGINDYFGPAPSEGIESIHRLAIFNRWGALIFEARDISSFDETKMWNGTFKGKEANPGVYVYLIELKLTDERNLILKGNVTLIK
ncbi:MAG: gliding motility-associated C-terminal domain-containing protein [Saprospiraceae bacterium]|nr:gliding motility-associated C-terminal domain-containing protein [Saprospiraceae bacterium]